MIVLDASAVVDILLRRGAYHRIEDRIIQEGETLHAPFLLDAEVLNALRHYALSRELSSSRGREALEDYGDLRIMRYPHLPLLQRIWQLRNNLSAYDALYIALAEALDAPLITADAALSRAPGHRAGVEVYA